MMMVVVVNVSEFVLHSPTPPRSLPLKQLLLSREERPTLLMTPIDSDARCKQPGQGEASVKVSSLLFS